MKLVNNQYEWTEKSKESYAYQKMKEGIEAKVIKMNKNKFVKKPLFLKIIVSHLIDFSTFSSDDIELWNYHFNIWKKVFEIKEPLESPLYVKHTQIIPINDNTCYTFSYTTLTITNFNSSITFDSDWLNILSIEIIPKSIQEKINNNDPNIGEFISESNLEIYNILKERISIPNKNIVIKKEEFTEKQYDLKKFIFDNYISLWKKNKKPNISVI
ncbi:MAG: hypothetical protein WC934_06115 [Acidithiobacillus sp.]|jgi:hypothetical protein